MNLRDLFLRIRALVAPHRVECELDEELSFHIDRETQKHIAAGLSAADARTRARARFGPVPLAAVGWRIQARASCRKVGVHFDQSHFVSSSSRRR